MSRISACADRSRNIDFTHDTVFALRECSPCFACTKADVSPPNDEFDHVRRDRGATFGQDTKEPVVHLVKVGQVG